MTTETTRHPVTGVVAPAEALGAGAGLIRVGTARSLAVTALAVVLLGAAMAVAGAAVDGRPAAFGAVLGTVLAVLVLGGGAFVLDVVAGVLPVASLLVALLTYVLQLLVLGMVLLALERSGLLGADLDRQWVGGALIVATLGWLVVATTAFARRRVPVFDLPEGGRS